MTMPLTEAIAYVDRGLEKARQMGVAVSCAVVDEFGQLVQLDRMDGAALMSPDIAAAKAVTALNFKRPTSEVGKMDAAALRSIADAVNFKLVALAGGVPIFRDAALRGAIGVSGATSQQDEELARFAVDG
jgi:glc operon protein GlcG